MRVNVLQRAEIDRLREQIESRGNRTTHADDTLHTVTTSVMASHP